MVSDQSLCYPLRLIEFESWPYLPTLANFYGLGILQSFGHILAYFEMQLGTFSVDVVKEIGLKF